MDEVGATKGRRGGEGHGVAKKKRGQPPYRSEGGVLEGEGRGRGHRIQRWTKRKRTTVEKEARITCRCTVGGYRMKKNKNCWETKKEKAILAPQNGMGTGAKAKKKRSALVPKTENKDPVTKKGKVTARRQSRSTSFTPQRGGGSHRREDLDDSSLRVPDTEQPSQNLVIREDKGNTCARSSQGGVKLCMLEQSRATIGWELKRKIEIETRNSNHRRRLAQERQGKQVTKKGKGGFRAPPEGEGPQKNKKPPVKIKRGRGPSETGGKKSESTTRRGHRGRGKLRGLVAWKMIPVWAGIWGKKQWAADVSNAP